MRIFSLALRLCAAGVLFAPSPSAAQDDTTRAASRRAASCFERFAAGRALPPVPQRRPGRSRRLPAGQLAIVQALTQQDSPRDPAAAEARARLRHCLPAALAFDTRLTRGQARWLAHCFSDAHASGGVPVCMAVGRAMATYDPDVGEMFSRSDVQRPLPGVVLSPVSHPSRVTARDNGVINALAQTSAALVQCRDAHGFGRMGIVAAYEAGQWVVHGRSDEGSDGLRACVLQALLSASPPVTASGPVAVELSLLEPANTPAADTSGDMDGAALPQKEVAAWASRGLTPIGPACRAPTTLRTRAR